MPEKRLQTGEMLFREGEAAPIAFLLLEGRVEVFRQGDSGEVKLTEYGPGEMLGETALFDDMNQYLYSVRALTDIMVESLSGNDVQTALGGCPPRLVPIVMSIFKRLRTHPIPPVQASDAPKKEAAPKEQIVPVLGEDVEKIVIQAASDEVAVALKFAEVPTSHLPFRIGGYDKHMEVSQIRKGNHLNIPSEGPPLTVSINHCEIIQQDGTIYVLDLGSRQGTVVNGYPIGRGKGFYKAPLQKGENIVILGEKKNSPYKLKVIC